MPPPPTPPPHYASCVFSLMVPSKYSSMPMEAFDCPDEPPADYPKGYPAMDVINHWNPDDAEQVPPQHYVSTCRWVTLGHVTSHAVSCLAKWAERRMGFGALNARRFWIWSLLMLGTECGLSVCWVGAA